MNRRHFLAGLGFSLVAQKTFANFTPPANDTIYGQQWHIPLIQADKAWIYSQGSTGTIIAVIGSGVTLPVDYPASSVAGYNFIDNNTNTADKVAGDGHDSFTTALAMAATNNGQGSAGICPNATLMPLVCANSSGAITTLNFDSCVDFAIANGAHIYNMSLTGVSSSADSHIAAALSVGALMFAATGDTGNSQPNSRPAMLPGVIGVAATDKNDLIASYSSFGSNRICAPGGANGGGSNGLCTTGATGTSACGIAADSFAVPIATGVGALMRTANPRYAALRWDEMSLLMFKYGCDAVQGKAGWPTLDATYGYGRINALKCVLAAADYVRPFAVKSLSLGG